MILLWENNATTMPTVIHYAMEMGKKFITVSDSFQNNETFYFNCLWGI